MAAQHVGSAVSDLAGVRNAVDFVLGASVSVGAPVKVKLRQSVDVAAQRSA